MHFLLGPFIPSTNATGSGQGDCRCCAGKQDHEPNEWRGREQVTAIGRGKVHSAGKHCSGLPRARQHSGKSISTLIARFECGMFSEQACLIKQESRGGKRKNKSRYARGLSLHTNYFYRMMKHILAFLPLMQTGVFPRVHFRIRKTCETSALSKQKNVRAVRSTHTSTHARTIRHLFMHCSPLIIFAYAPPLNHSSLD